MERRFLAARTLEGAKLFSMPADVHRIRPQARIQWQLNSIKLFLEQTSQFRWYLIVGNKKAVIIRQGDKMPIEQPMHRPG